MKTLGKVLAQVTYADATKKGNQCPVVSQVILSVDGRQIASATLGGHYNVNQALAEFKKNPSRFVKLPACKFELADLARI